MTLAASLAFIGTSTNNSAFVMRLVNLTGTLTVYIQDQVAAYDLYA